MVKSWQETIGEHRRDVRASIIEAIWSLLCEKGPLAITMAKVAERAGVTRATLYKSFPSVEAILVAAHEELVESHLAQLSAAVGTAQDAGEALSTLVNRYATIAHHRAQAGGPDLHSLLHPGGRRQIHETRLLELFAQVIADAQASGEVREDANPSESAAYCVAALAAAAQLPERALPALARTVIAGLRRTA